MRKTPVAHAHPRRPRRLAPALCDNPSAQRTGGGLKLLGVVDFRFVYECADGHVTVTFLPGVLVGSFTNRLLSWVAAEGHLDADLAAPFGSLGFSDVTEFLSLFGAGCPN